MRNFSRLSQSWLVRQKTMACSILSASTSRSSMRGLRRFTASLQHSLDALPTPTSSHAWQPSVGTAGSLCSQLRSSFGSTLTTTWSTASGTASLPLRSTHVGFSVSSPASFLTSGECSVAENMSVCRRCVPVPRLGSLLKSLRMSSALPVSSSRSASSSTKKRTALTSSLPWRIQSATQRGVPTTTSTPSSSCRACFLWSMPPTNSPARSSGATMYRLYCSMHW
mmetsp:Transcript_10901/g.45205  ORF Transcript_10901/g.45205 Transcript_10901/m.45205 type:complete len:224 (+) Transcript_10901:792-1463(+)